MGIVNLTDDSYYAASRCGDLDQTLARVAALVGEGADVIDVGACSSRPGSMPIGAAEEWRRLRPVLKEVLAAFPDVRLSIDTCWSEVVQRTYDLIGKFMVNDISSGEDDPDMLSVVGKLDLKYVAMHKRGCPTIMQTLTDYKDVVGEIIQYFEYFAQKALQFEIKDWILDPGLGFAKTVGQNYEIVSRLDEFKTFSRPVLVGASRKSMIYKYLQISPEESLAATQVVHLKALQMGADILRVHDVAEAKRTISMYRLLG